MATYAAFGLTKFLFYIVGIGVAFFGAAILTYFVGFVDLGASKEVKNDSESNHTNEIMEDADITVASPVNGNAISMDLVKDEVFSSEALGKGVGIEPKNGEIVAPEDCTVLMVYPTLHALGLKLDSGVELIIHVGIDTVNLEGKYFEKFVEEGAHVKKGTKLLTFDKEKIAEAGFDTVVLVIVSNTDDYLKVAGQSGAYVDNKTEIIKIKK